MASLPATSTGFLARSGRMNGFARMAGQRLSLLAVFLLLWWLAAQRVPAFILPGPGKTWSALTELIANGTFAEDLGSTLYRVVAGFSGGFITRSTSVTAVSPACTCDSACSCRYFPRCLRKSCLS